MRILAVLILLLTAPLAWPQSGADLFDLINQNDVAAVSAALAAGADPDQRQAQGLQATPLMWATGRADPAIVQALVNAGADVDAIDVMGDPAINWAAYYGNVPAIRILLDAGANTYLTGHGDAVQIVMRRGHQNALQLLLSHRGDLPDPAPADSALLDALTENDTDRLTALAADHDYTTLTDFAGRPAVQAAARANAGEAIRWLAANGADIDAADAIGFTALFEAARDGQAQAVSVLLDLGADANRRADASALSLTPLHMAAIGDHAEIVERLLASGADPDVQGTMGATPLMWAVFEGSQNSARVLLEGGANAGLATGDGTTFVAIARQRGWDALADMAEAQNE